MMRLPISVSVLTRPKIDVWGSHLPCFFPSTPHTAHRATILKGARESGKSNIQLIPRIRLFITTYTESKFQSCSSNEYPCTTLSPPIRLNNHLACLRLCSNNASSSLILASNALTLPLKTSLLFSLAAIKRSCRARC